MECRMARSISLLRSLVLVALSAAVPACGYDDMSGDYEGALDCGDAGSLGMSLSIGGDKGAGIYPVDGEVRDLTLDGLASSVEMTGELAQMAEAGPQVVEVGVECSLIQEGEASALDCAAFNQLAWDGADTLSADVTNFLGAELNCAISLTR
jgi:hypothetical protein